VSPHVRQRVLVAVAAILTGISLLPAGHRPFAAPRAPEAREYAPFARSVVASAPGLPAYARDAHARMRQQFDSVNAMWEGAYRATGDEFERPALTPPEQPCGSPGGGWAGLYCGRDARITIDLAGHLARHSRVGQAISDVILGYVVAHEVGHHVQALRHAPEDVLRRELHAQCLAGVWGRAANMPLPPTWVYGEDSEHGSRVQQIQWLNVGYRSGRPSDCDTIWSTSTSP